MLACHAKGRGFKSRRSRCVVNLHPFVICKIHLVCLFRMWFTKRRNILNRKHPILQTNSCLSFILLGFRCLLKEIKIERGKTHPLLDFF